MLITHFLIRHLRCNSYRSASKVRDEVDKDIQAGKLDRKFSVTKDELGRPYLLGPMGDRNYLWSNGLIQSDPEDVWIRKTVALWEERKYRFDWVCTYYTHSIAYETSISYVEYPSLLEMNLGKTLETPTGDPYFSETFLRRSPLFS